MKAIVSRLEMGNWIYIKFCECPSDTLYHEIKLPRFLLPDLQLEDELEVTFKPVEKA